MPMESRLVGWRVVHLSCREVQLLNHMARIGVPKTATSAALNR